MSYVEDEFHQSLLPHDCLGHNLSCTLFIRMESIMCKEDCRNIQRESLVTGEVTNGSLPGQGGIFTGKVGRLFQLRVEKLQKLDTLSSF